MDNAQQESHVVPLPIVNEGQVKSNKCNSYLTPTKLQCYNSTVVHIHVHTYTQRIYMRFLQPFAIETSQLNVKLIYTDLSGAGLKWPQYYDPPVTVYTYMAIWSWRIAAETPRQGIGCEFRRQVVVLFLQLPLSSCVVRKACTSYTSLHNTY